MFVVYEKDEKGNPRASGFFSRKEDAANLVNELGPKAWWQELPNKKAATKKKEDKGG